MSFFTARYPRGVHTQVPCSATLKPPLIPAMDFPIAELMYADRLLRNARLSHGLAPRRVRLPALHQGAPGMPTAWPSTGRRRPRSWTTVCGHCPAVFNAVSSPTGPPPRGVKPGGPFRTGPEIRAPLDRPGSPPPPLARELECEPPSELLNLEAKTGSHDLAFGTANPDCRWIARFLEADEA